MIFIAFLFSFFLAVLLLKSFWKCDGFECIGAYFWISIISALLFSLYILFRKFLYKSKKNEHSKNFNSKYLIIAYMLIGLAVYIFIEGIPTQLEAIHIYVALTYLVAWPLMILQEWTNWI